MYDKLRACCAAAAACWCVSCARACVISAMDVLPRCRLLMLMREYLKFVGARVLS
jgi:hypothetical protein